MTYNRATHFMIINGKMFLPSSTNTIKNNLMDADDDRFLRYCAPNYKNPTTMLLVSLTLGGLGVDRFMLGDTKIGLLKLFTLGCLGLLTLSDWFSVTKRTQAYNGDLFQKSSSFSF